jgi:hypothetical protein
MLQWGGEVQLIIFEFLERDGIRNTKKIKISFGISLDLHYL